MSTNLYLVPPWAPTWGSTCPTTQPANTHPWEPVIKTDRPDPKRERSQENTICRRSLAYKDTFHGRWQQVTLPTPGLAAKRRRSRRCFPSTLLSFRIFPSNTLLVRFSELFSDGQHLGLDPEELDIEVKGGVGRDHSASATAAVPKLRRDRDLTALPDLRKRRHQRQNKRKHGDKHKTMHHVRQRKREM